MSAEKPPAYVLTPEDIKDLENACIDLGAALGRVMGIVGRVETTNEKRWEEGGRAAAAAVISRADLDEIERFINGEGRAA